MILRLFFFLIVLITFVNCKEEINTSKQLLDKEQISTEILQMFDAYHTAIKENGLEAEFDFLDNSSDFFGFRQVTILPNLMSR